MLPKSRRLKGADWFKEGKTIRSLFFRAKVKTGTGRVGLVVGKKMATNAVIRNKWRRFMYGHIKNWLIPGYDAIIIFDPAVKSDVSMVTAGEDLETLYKKLTA